MKLVLNLHDLYSTVYQYSLQSTRTHTHCKTWYTQYVCTMRRFLRGEIRQHVHRDLDFSAEKSDQKSAYGTLLWTLLYLFNHIVRSKWKYMFAHNIPQCRVNDFHAIEALIWIFSDFRWVWRRTATMTIPEWRIKLAGRPWMEIGQ